MSKDPTKFFTDFSELDCIHTYTKSRTATQDFETMAAIVLYNNVIGGFIWRISCVADNSNRTYGLDVDPDEEWLVADSGQFVDVSTENNEALCQAAKNQRIEVIKFLLFDSGQLARVLARNCNWSLFVPEKIQTRVEQAVVVNTFLKAKRFPIAKRHKYLVSDVCYQAVAAGLAKTATDLDQLLHASQRLAEQTRKIF